MKILKYLKNPVFYTRLVGAILFLLGILGFAFKGEESLPGVYLFGSLVLGFWGLVVGARRENGSPTESNRLE